MDTSKMTAAEVRKRINELDVFLNNPKNFDKPNFIQLKRDRRMLVERERDFNINGLYELNI